MKTPIVLRLVLKDWYIERVGVSLLIGSVIVAGILAAIPWQDGFPIGLNLTLVVLISLNFYLPLSTVLDERHSKTLPFTMSLPISPIEYTVAKIIANLLLYLMPWTVASISFAVISKRGASPIAHLWAGYMDVFLIAFIVIFMVILGIALIFESIGWTVFLNVILGIVGVNVAFQVVPRIPTLRAFVLAVGRRGPEHIWTLVAEFATLLLLVAVTFLVQSKKQDFL